MSTELSIYRNERLDPPSTFFFPLRTNVHYFDSPQNQLALLGRIKQASLLHDVLLFEAGMYQAAVWLRDGKPGGPIMDMWMTPENVEELQLDEDDQSFKPTGGEATLIIAGYAFGAGAVERRYRSQFHGVLKSLGADSLPWIRVEPFDLTPEGGDAVKDAGRADDKKLGGMVPEASRFLKDKLLFNLNRDLLVASELGAAASMDELFTPMLRQKASRPRETVVAEGHTALEVTVPNWSHMPWEEIVKLREHPAIAEFRKRIVTIERVAREAAVHDPSGDLRDEIRKVYEDDLMDEVESLRVTKEGLAKDVTIDFTTGLLPIPLLSSAVTGVRGLLKMRSEQRSWVSPLLKLRKISREANK